MFEFVIIYLVWFIVDLVMVLKTCKVCHEEKNIEYFSKHLCVCKVWVLVQRRMYYIKNRKRENYRTNAAKMKVRQFIHRSFIGKSCVLCGCDNPEVFEYDHIDPSTKKIHVCRAHSIKAAQVEIKKCRIVCSNCHCRVSRDQRLAQRTPDQHVKSSVRCKRKRRAALQRFVDDKKKEIGKCQLCHFFDCDYLCMLHFDHINPKNKINSIAGMVSTLADKDVLLNEMDKCRLLCANCHRLETRKQLGWRFIGYS